METRVEQYHLDSPNEDEVSDCESVVSDCESIVSVEKSELFGKGLVRLDETDRVFQILKMRLHIRLSSLGLHTQVKAIHKYEYSGLRKQAKLQSFWLFSRSVEQNCEGDGNRKYGWYGGSKEEIMKILAYGFGESISNGVYGKGVYLSPCDHPLDSLQSLVVDEDGLRHLLLCRVIMGKMELVSPGSQQTHPSSEDFDSGVDDLSSPKKYIIWSTHMNTHILPEYVVSVRAPTTMQECERISVPMKKPSSPWMSFPVLISELSKILNMNSIKLIKKHHSDHRERKITRHELIRRVRLIAGDKLLAAVIKTYKDKHSKTSTSNSLTNIDVIECVREKRNGIKSAC